MFLHLQIHVRGLKYYPVAVAGPYAIKYTANALYSITTPQQEKYYFRDSKFQNC